MIYYIYEDLKKRGGLASGDTKNNKSKASSLLTHHVKFSAEVREAGSDRIGFVLDLYWIGLDWIGREVCAYHGVDEANEANETEGITLRTAFRNIRRREITSY